MSSKITSILGASSFEVTRDKIAEILAVEIANQRTLLEAYIPTIDPLNTQEVREANFALSCLPEKVWVDRFTRPGNGEITNAWLNVVFSKRKPAMLQSASIQQADNFFMIEAWARGSSTVLDSGDLERGDTISSRRLSRVLGVCSQILRAKCYRKLDMPSQVGVLESCAIDIAQPEYGAETKENILFGSMIVRAQLNDTAFECTGGVLAAGVDTEMRVNDQDSIYWKTTF